MISPRISICIPTYNGEKFLAAAIESAMAQAGDDVEIFFSDDGSTDGTVAIIDRCAALDPRIRIARSEKNRGLVGNWNRCMYDARGEWIKFLFQDDVLYPNYLQRVRPYLDGACPFIISHRDLYIEPGTPEDFAQCYRGLLTLRSLAPREQVLTPEDFSWILANFHTYNFIGEPSNTMFRRSLVRQAGFFNEGMHQIVDMEFWARIGVQFGAVHIPDALSMFRVHPSSTTARNFAITNFRTQVLDTMMLLHDFCFAPHFRNLREAARLGKIPLEAYFAAYVKHSNEDIVALEKNNVSPAVLEEELYRPWGACCLTYPVLWKVVKTELSLRAAILKGLFPKELE